MKKLAFISSLLIFVSFGCSDFDRRTQFNATYTNRVILDSNNTLPGNQHEVFSDTLVVDFIGLLVDHNSNENGLESVSLVGLSIEIDKKKSPDSGNFDFLRNIEIFLKGKNTQEFLIGRADSVPQGKIRYFEIRVVPEDEDFSDFVKSEEFICRMKYSTDNRIKDSAIVIKVTPTYLIDTKKFGV